MRALVLVVALLVSMGALAMVMRTVLCERDVGRHTGMTRFAKDHGCRRVALKRHGKHHNPKNEEAYPVHVANSRWNSVLAGANVCPVPCATLWAASRDFAVVASQVSFFGPEIRRAIHRGSQQHVKSTANPFGECEGECLAVLHDGLHSVKYSN